MHNASVMFEKAPAIWDYSAFKDSLFRAYNIRCAGDAALEAVLKKSFHYPFEMLSAPGGIRAGVNGSENVFVNKRKKI